MSRCGNVAAQRNAELGPLIHRRQIEADTGGTELNSGEHFGRGWPAREACRTTRYTHADLGRGSDFFGSKQRLFGEALALRANPAQTIAGQMQGPLGELSRRLLTVLLETWDRPENRPTLPAIAQAGGGPDGSALTRRLVEEALAAPIAERLQDDAAPADELIDRFAPALDSVVRDCLGHRQSS